MNPHVSQDATTRPVIENLEILADLLRHLAPGHGAPLAVVSAETVVAVWDGTTHLMLPALTVARLDHREAGYDHPRKLKARGLSVSEWDARPLAARLTDVVEAQTPILGPSTGEQFVTRHAFIGTFTRPNQDAVRVALLQHIVTDPTPTQRRALGLPDLEQATELAASEGDQS